MASTLLILGEGQFTGAFEITSFISLVNMFHGEHSTEGRDGGQTGGDLLLWIQESALCPYREAIFLHQLES